MSDWLVIKSLGYSHIYSALMTILSAKITCVGSLSLMSVVFHNDGPSWVGVNVHNYKTKFILSSFRILKKGTSG